MTIFGIDISNNNNGPDGSLVDLAKVKAEGFEFVFCKVSEGTYLRDSTWPKYRDAAKANGLLLAGYHYLTTEDVNAQVDSFLLQLADPNCPIMVDFEANSGSQANLWAFINACNARGREVALTYEPGWYDQQIGGDVSKVPGWIQSSYVTGTGYAASLYPGDDNFRWSPLQGRTPDILQFTDRAIVAGKAVDANAFHGTREQLAALLGVKAKVTVTAPLPVPPMTDHQLALDTRAQLTGGLTGYPGWSMLGDRTVVVALAAIGEHLGITGFKEPKKGAS